MSARDGYSLDDPRPIAADAPYTFFLPSEDQLEALLPGDFVKLIVRSVPQSERWDAERLWFTILEVRDGTLVGRLDNEPDDIPALRLGSKVGFQAYHVIDIIWNESRDSTPPPDPERREYWDRCPVDRCVTEEGAPVHYLYREEPEPKPEEERDADSGWRIRGDYRHQRHEDLDAREVEYVALGRVLNADDSWRHLVDSPVGSAFVRDWDTGRFVPSAEAER
ncbi:MAG: DUF2185 domain-containing protein [Pseudomonadota bacterium]|nr:DUF2185 domain-containing protein [Pseudomonadota bacterium]